MKRARGIARFLTRTSANATFMLLLGVIAAILIIGLYIIIDVKTSVDQQTEHNEKVRQWTLQINDFLYKKFKFDGYYVIGLQSNILNLTDKKKTEGLTTEESEALDIYKKKLLRILTQDPSIRMPEPQTNSAPSSPILP